MTSFSMYLWMTYKIMLLVSTIAVILAFGLWFFPEPTRQVVTFAIVNAKPIAVGTGEFVQKAWNVIP